MVSRKLANLRAVLRKAREVKDPFVEFATAVRSCNVNSQLVQIRSYHARDLAKELQEWCLATCRENMAAMYDRVWTWSDSKKRKQLTSAASRFLIAHDAAPDRSPLAYINYRFEEDEGYPVLYCYELQVVRGAQSRGLGRTLMELAEQIAWGAGMSKVMLTVFAENTAAVAFYRKLGYILDETSPDYVPPCSGTHSAGGGVSSRMASEAGRSSSSSSAGIASGSGNGSSTCTTHAGSGSGSGSQTASGSGNATGGYHIMSKRAPTTVPMQLGQCGVGQEQQQQQQQPHEQRQVPLLHQAGVSGDAERRQEAEPRDPTCIGSCKRQRTDAQAEPQVLSGRNSSLASACAAATPPPLSLQAGQQPAAQSQAGPHADRQAVGCYTVAGTYDAPDVEEGKQEQLQGDGEGEVNLELGEAAGRLVRKGSGGSGRAALPERAGLSEQLGQPEDRPMDIELVEQHLTEPGLEATSEEAVHSEGQAAQNQKQQQQAQELTHQRQAEQHDPPPPLQPQQPQQQGHEEQEGQQQGQEEQHAQVQAQEQEQGQVRCALPALAAEGAVEQQRGLLSGRTQQQQPALEGCQPEQEPEERRHRDMSASPLKEPGPPAPGGCGLDGRLAADTTAWSPDICIELSGPSGSESPPGDGGDGAVADAAALLG